MRWYVQDEVNQDYSEQNKVDGMKKGADSTGKVMHMWKSGWWLVVRKIHTHTMTIKPRQRQKNTKKNIKEVKYTEQDRTALAAWHLTTAGFLQCHCHAVNSEHCATCYLHFTALPLQPTVQLLLFQMVNKSCRIHCWCSNYNDAMWSHSTHHRSVDSEWMLTSETWSTISDVSRSFAASQWRLCIAVNTTNNQSINQSLPHRLHYQQQLA